MKTNSLSICDFLCFPLLQLFDIYCTPAHESSRPHLSDFNTTALFYHLQTLLRSTCHKTGVPPVCTRTLLPCCSSKIWFPLKIGRLCLPACMKLSISSPGEVSSKRPACLSNPLPIARVLFFFVFILCRTISISLSLHLIISKSTPTQPIIHYLDFIRQTKQAFAMATNSAGRTIWDDRARSVLLQAVMDVAPPSADQWESIMEKVQESGYSYTPKAALYACLAHACLPLF